MTRLSVNINDATQDALRRVRDRDQVSVTEAVRRLIGYGDILDQAFADAGQVVLDVNGKRYVVKPAEPTP